MSKEFIAAESSGKLRAVADLKFLSSHWDTRMKECDTLEANAAQLREGDRMLSMDLASGYRRFRLHPSMRNWFVVSLFGIWFQYIALPFGLWVSGYWFVRLVGRFRALLRGQMKFRVLYSVGDFLICPAVCRHSTRRDCLRASTVISRLLNYYGIKRHPDTGVWGGGTTYLVRLGFVVDAVRCKFGTPVAKMEKVTRMAQDLM
jgi:hypothetical protein